MKEVIFYRTYEISDDEIEKFAVDNIRQTLDMTSDEVAELIATGQYLRDYEEFMDSPIDFVSIKIREDGRE